MFGKSKMSKEDLMAKKMALGNLRKEATDTMDDDLKGLKEMKMKKVTVASPDDSGLEEGLDKAKSMLSMKDHLKNMTNDLGETGADQSEDAGEGETDMDAAPENMSLEDVDKKLQMLMKLKQHLMSKTNHNS